MQASASECVTSQPNQLGKRSVITALMEYPNLRITSIDDVIAKCCLPKLGPYVAYCHLLRSVLITQEKRRMSVVFNSGNSLRLALLSLDSSSLRLPLRHL